MFLHPWTQKWGEQHSLAGEGVGRTQFGRLEGKLVTLYTLCVTCFFNNMGMAYLYKFGAAWAGGLGVGLYRKLRDDTVIHVCS